MRKLWCNPRPVTATSRLACPSEETTSPDASRRDRSRLPGDWAGCTEKRGEQAAGSGLMVPPGELAVACPNWPRNHDTPSMRMHDAEWGCSPSPTHRL